MGYSQLTGVGTIVAVSTPPGKGGIAVIRLSGADAIPVLSRVWSGKNPSEFQSHTTHLGLILDEKEETIDQVVAGYFRGPNSYTGEDTIEISCHGSPWIQQAIVNRLIEAGARAAGPGEFTIRAFRNGRIDLAQADGIADLISSSSKAAARIALSQMRGEFSNRLESLRQQLVNLGVLLELELDFSEEDVEFADRERLIELTREIRDVVARLSDSYRSGRAFKNGVPVAIAGVPNAGKSSLLNALLGDDRAIVSDIPGTTRDIIEDAVEIDGVLFRFIDTAGLRETEDKIEMIGVERAKETIGKAFILLYLIDPTVSDETQREALEELKVPEGVKIITVYTKSDLEANERTSEIKISSHTGEGLEVLKKRLVDAATAEFNPERELVITNARHYEALTMAKAPLERLEEGLETGLTPDFLAQELREADSYLGEITGAVTSDEILHTVFHNYCIGK